MTDRVPVTIAGQPPATIVLEADPYNETLDVWNDFINTVIVLLMFSGQTIFLIYLFIARALRPLYRLGAALEQIGRGNFATRVEGRLPPELAELHDNFNRMAGRLAAADADNRRLNEQLLTVQEQERAEIARDLHDEVGPYLFAINIDTRDGFRVCWRGRAAEAPEHLQLIAEAVGHMQQELYSAVRRLQPVGLAEFGLSDAIDNMIQFWRRRHPEIDFHVIVRGRRARRSASLSMRRSIASSRNASPTLCATAGRRASGFVSTAAAPDQIVLEIADNGSGMPDAPGPGLWLARNGRAGQGDGRAADPRQRSRRWSHGEGDAALSGGARGASRRVRRMRIDGR